MNGRRFARLRTVRARLALTYSAWLFGITAVVLGAVYFALSATMSTGSLDPVVVKKFHQQPDGTLVYRVGEKFEAADLAQVQQYVNLRTLERFRDYGLIALASMFLLSLVVGWWVAGRALRPVERITTATREITSTDLSRRIGATGPPDELRVLADTLDEMLARLEASFRAERRLVEDVSHELRNPVAVVQANIDAVLASDDATAEQRREAIAVVTRATGRMSQLLEDLLATARLRSRAFEERPVDLARLTGECVDEQRLIAADRELDIRTHLAPGPVVYADPSALARAIGNLLANAIRLAPAASTVTVATGSVQGWAFAAVRDSGPGISSADVAVIFERFRSGAGGNGTGTGLGLAIARQIVESHQGRIAVHSEPSVGSTFVVWLPDRAGGGHESRPPAHPALAPLVPGAT